MIKRDGLGLVKTSLVDYPDALAAVVFTPGCNMRCPYCHNPELVSPINKGELLPYDEVLRFLEKRSKLLEGVVITGGEPLIHEDIVDFVAAIKSLGLKIKLDTNGSLPSALSKINADYYAMDIKSDPRRYPKLGINLEDMEYRLRESLEVIRKSGKPYELRTTASPDFLDDESLSWIISLLRKGERYAIAQYNPEKTLASEATPAYLAESLEKFVENARKAGIDCFARGIR